MNTNNLISNSRGFVQGSRSFSYLWLASLRWIIHFVGTSWQRRNNHQRNCHDLVSNFCVLNSKFGKRITHNIYKIVGNLPINHTLFQNHFFRLNKNTHQAFKYLEFVQRISRNINFHLFNFQNAHQPRKVYGVYAVHSRPWGLPWKDDISIGKGFLSYKIIQLLFVGMIGKPASIFFKYLVFCYRIVRNFEKTLCEREKRTKFKINWHFDLKWYVILKNICAKGKYWPIIKICWNFDLKPYVILKRTFAKGK